MLIYCGGRADEGSLPSNRGKADNHQLWDEGRRRGVNGFCGGRCVRWESPRACTHMDYTWRHHTMVLTHYWLSKKKRSNSQGRDNGPCLPLLPGPEGVCAVLRYATSSGAHVFCPRWSPRGVSVRYRRYRPCPASWRRNGVMGVVQLWVHESSVMVWFQWWTGILV